MTDSKWAGFDVEELAGKVAGYLQENPHVGATWCDDPLPRTDPATCEHEGMSCAAVLRLVPGASRAPEPPRNFRESAMFPAWHVMQSAADVMNVEAFQGVCSLVLALLATPAHRLASTHESKGGCVVGCLEAALTRFLESADPLWPQMPEDGPVQYSGQAEADALEAVNESLAELLLQAPEQFDRIRNRQTTRLQILRHLPVNDWRAVGWAQPGEGIPLHLSKLQPLIQPVEEVAMGFLPRHEEFRSAARILMRLASTPAVELTEEPATDPETNELEQRIQAAGMLERKGMALAPELQQSLQADRAILQRIKAGS